MSQHVTTCHNLIPIESYRIQSFPVFQPSNILKSEDPEYPRMIKSCDILGTLLRVKDLIVQSFHLDAGAFAGQFWPLMTLRWPLAPAKAALPALAWATSGALWSESLCNSNRDHVY